MVDAAGPSPWTAALGQKPLRGGKTWTASAAAPLRVQKYPSQGTQPSPLLQDGEGERRALAEVPESLWAALPR